MMSLLVIVAFLLGFAFGVWERKVDRLKVNKDTFKNIKEPEAEVLNTPTVEELKKQSDKEFYDAIK